MQSDLPALSDYVAEHPGTFGGLWVDQAAGATINIVVGPGADVDEAAIEALTPDGATVNLTEGAYTQRELDATRAPLELALLASELAWTSIAVDVRQNSVVVQVQAGAEEAAREFVAPYGPSVTIEVSPEVRLATCGGRGDCGTPMKGGLLIDSFVSPYSYGCTSAFMPRPSDLNDDRLLVMTAGHCLDSNTGTGLSATWWHPSSPTTNLGTGETETYYVGTSADGGFIRDSDPDGKNFLFASGYTDVRRVGGHRTNAQQDQGLAICMQGRASAYRCDEITVEDATVSGTGFTLYHQWKFGIGVRDGDSGGPVFQNHYANGETSAHAYGVVSGGTDPDVPGEYGWYSTIDWISQFSERRPCYSTSCGL